jgi:hypothetical protein
MTPGAIAPFQSFPIGNSPKGLIGKSLTGRDMGSAVCLSRQPGRQSVQVNGLFAFAFFTKYRFIHRGKIVCCGNKHDFRNIAIFISNYSDILSPTELICILLTPYTIRFIFDQYRF